jgi:hypothetical protein
MADHIPFLNSPDDLSIFKAHFSDSDMVRLSLKSLGRVTAGLPEGTKLWIDGTMDGLDQLSRLKKDNDYLGYVSRFSCYQNVGDEQFQSKPEKSKVDSFVKSVLGACTDHLSPAWLSVPQLPQAGDSSRNKINRLLASSAAKWKVTSDFKGKLILPIIFTNRKQLHSKVERRKHIQLARRCFDDSGATGSWVVDSSLKDHDGSSSNDRMRFPDLIKFHEELVEAMPKETVVIAGPYWGMNLVLWARGLVRHPVVGLGSSFQYYSPAWPPRKTVKVRLALEPLRRLAFGAHLPAWLEHALARLSKDDEIYLRFSELAKQVPHLVLDNYKCKLQVAKFYKDWFNSIATVNPSGRALALFHDLSTAYVVGKKLPELHKDEETARKPFIVAQHLMAHCL